MSEKPSGQPAGASDELVVPTPNIASTNSAESEVQPAAPQLDESALLGKLKASLVPDFEKMLDERLPSAAQRAAQSVKDVRLKPLEGLSKEDFQLILDLAKKHSGNVDAVQDEVALRSFREEREAARRGEPTAPASQPAPASSPDKAMSEAEQKAKIVETLSEFKLSQELNQAILNEWGKGTYSSFDAALEGVKVAAKIAAASTAPPPTGAGIVGPTSTGVGLQTGPEREKAVAELNDKMAEYFKNPSRYAKEMAETKKALRDLGVEHI